MQVSGVSLPRGRQAYRAINDQLQSGSTDSAQAFVLVGAPMAVGPGVVPAAVRMIHVMQYAD